MSEPMRRFGAVILAAGQSSRMGGPNKLLQDWLGRPLLSHALECVESLGLGDAVCVTGRDAMSIAELASEADIRPVYNPLFAKGMGTSIAAGVRTLGPDLDGIFIVPGDMPALRPELYRSLAARWSAGKIVVPVFEGQRGHPVLFPAALRGDLERLSGDSGARSILLSSADRLVKVAVENETILFDCDSPADFAKKSPGGE